MRREVVHPGADRLKYEIREIVAFARGLERWELPIVWENIGDPVRKGEPIADWIKEIVMRKAGENASFAYSETEGVKAAREFLAAQATARGGARLHAEDILFFNGLGDAVAKVFGFLKREARVLGPSPAYSTFSSAEAAHSGYEHLAYRLDPKRSWLPDMEDVELKVRYNDSIAGILIINPDNPTGAVYPEHILKEFVRIAGTYNLFIVCDETYANIIYGGAKTSALSQVIGEVPGIALRSLSKEVPWPGARCGWAEIYNRQVDPSFKAYAQSLLDAKRLEVCSTSLPQLCLSEILGDARYPAHLASRAARFASRAEEAAKAFASIRGVSINKPRGALYVTALFDQDLFNDGSSEERRLPVKSEDLAAHIDKSAAGAAPDKRFVYWLLAASGICVVPLSGFASDLAGFRFTLLEHDDAKRRWIYKTIAQMAEAYLASA